MDTNFVNMKIATSFRKHENLYSETFFVDETFQMSYRRKLVIAKIFRNDKISYIRKFL